MSYDDDFIRRHLGMTEEQMRRLQNPTAEERARRRWGVRSTRPYLLKDSD